MSESREVEQYEIVERLGHAFLIDDPSLAATEIARLSRLRFEQVEEHDGFDYILQFGGEAASNWRLFASCLDTDSAVFYPQRDDPVEQALKICATCIVREECLAGAVERREHYGIWGGATEQSRRTMVRSARRTEQDLTRSGRTIASSPGADQPSQELAYADDPASADSTLESIRSALLARHKTG
jgi:WhiB family transcriptional regulator, redox-sensing transcriptional regulator